MPHLPQEVETHSIEHDPQKKSDSSEKMLPIFDKEKVAMDLDKSEDSKPTPTVLAAKSPLQRRPVNFSITDLSPNSKKQEFMLTRFTELTLPKTKEQRESSGSP